MKILSNTLIVATIVVNTCVGGSVLFKNKSNMTSNSYSNRNEIPLFTQVDNPTDGIQTSLPNISSPEPLRCSTLSEATYYLGPVIPEIVNVSVNEPSDLGNANNGFIGAITTDYYVGAIFKYTVSPDFNGPGLPGDVEGMRGQYHQYDDDNNHENAQLWYLSPSDNLGYDGNDDSGSFCSSKHNPLDNKTSAEICSLVCPSCLINVSSGGEDVAAKLCDSSKSECVNGGLEVRGGFHLYVERADLANVIENPLSASIFDIQLIYYGTPKMLPPRSKLSDNQPKNSPGDARDCDVSRCDDTRSSAGDPIDVLTGNFDYSYIDLSLQTIAGELSLQRSYASLATDATTHPTDISPGWTHNQDIRLLFEGDTVWFKGHTLNQYRFDVLSDHVYKPYNGVLAELVFINGQYILTTSSISVYVFDGDGRLLSWSNERNFGFNYTYSDGKLYRVTEPISGRYLQFNYMSGVLLSISDSAGRQVSYAYNFNGDLSSVTDVRNNTWSYDYNNDHHITNIFAPGSPPEELLTITYDDQGRAYEQYDGAGNQLTHIDFNTDGSSTSLDANGIPTNYKPDCRGVITRTNFGNSSTTPGYFIDRAYDHNFNLTAIRGEDDETATSFHWSPDGVDLEGITDQAGNSTSFTYNAEHHLTRVDAPENQWRTFNYTGPLLKSSTENSSLGDITTTYTYTTSTDTPQPINLLKSITDALNNKTSFVYDSFGQLITIIDTENNQTHFTYDRIGQVTMITDALGRAELLEYDSSSAVTSIIQNYDMSHIHNENNQYNLSSTFGYDLQSRLETIKDTNGLTTSTIIYDDAGRIYQIFDALNNPTTYTYNEDGSLNSIHIAPDYLTTYHYDGLGRIYEIRDSLNHLDSAYTYNLDSTIATETDAAGLVTSYTYDALHRIKQVSDNSGHTVSTSYNTYGDSISITDALGRVTQYEYDDPGRLTAVIENYLSDPPAGYDALATNIRTEYTYDMVGNLINVKDANGNYTNYAYTDLYQLESITNPLNHMTSYTYDALGNQKTLTHPDTTVTKFYFDLVNRLTGIDYPVGSDPDVSLTYNALSQLIGMDDSLGHTAWEYTVLGQPKLITNPFGHSTAYTYNALGNRTQMVYGGRIINYEYNANGLLEGVLDGYNSLVAYSYDLADRLLSVTYPNDLTSTYTYDLSSLLLSITHQMNNHTLASYAYTYDMAGNVVNTKETSRYPNNGYMPMIKNGMEQVYPAPEWENSNSANTLLKKVGMFISGVFRKGSVSAMSTKVGIPPDQEIDYNYDALGRLKHASYATGMEYTYDYDKVGNRTSQTVNGVTTSYIYDVANRLSSVNGINYSWNDNGSLINDGLMNYTYNSSGLLSYITTPYSSFSFSYDGMGNRYAQSTGGHTAFYTLDLADGLTRVLSEGSTTILYGLGLIGQETGGKMEYAIADRLGSIRQLVTEDQQVTLLKSYDPFGNTLLDQGTGSSSFGYTGEQMDKSGLEYLRARYYNPETGRFITADPFPGALSLPASQNPYPYAINNPLSYTDPSGEILPFLAAGIAGGIIGGGMSMIEQCISSNDIQACMKCLDWGEVGAATAAGTVAGFFGFGVGLIGGVLGVGIIPTIATGLLTGMITGQVYRATEVAISGNWDQAGSVLFQPNDILLDGVLGMASCAVGWGIGKLFSAISKNVNTSANYYSNNNYRLVEFQGRRIYQMTNLNWDYVEPKLGISNRQLLNWGYAPIGSDGNPIHLHHLLQLEPGPLVEVKASTHWRGFKILHGLIPDGSSFHNDPLLSNQFNVFRRQYWIWRVKSH
jgi:RHS repeat-associated protein